MTNSNDWWEQLEKRRQAFRKAMREWVAAEEKLRDSRPHDRRWMSVLKAHSEAATRLRSAAVEAFGDYHATEEDKGET